MIARIYLGIAAGFCLFNMAGAAAEIHAGWWHGRKVTYKIVNDRAIWQGDMVIRLSDISSTPPLDLTAKAGMARRASFLGTYAGDLWPNATVPYTIAGGVSAKQRTSIASAVQDFTSNTPIQWVPRANQANFVTFRSESATANECGNSDVGMQGGQQFITISADPSCGGVATLVHEMGHAIGFEHEQTRADRNYYLTVRYDNMDKNTYSQFDQDLTQIDLLPYEYASVMQYTADGDQRNDFDTIDTIPPGIALSNQTGLSAGDIEAIRTMYGSPSTTTTIATNSAGLKVVVDGQTVTTPQTLNWAPGSQHTLSVAAGSQPGAAGVRYVFARWSNDGAANQTVVASTANRLITANFAVQYQLPVSVSGGGGVVSVSPSSPDGYYTSGTVVTITATPNAGFSFLGWSGQVSDLTADSDNPTRFAVNFSGLKYAASFGQGPITTIGSTFSNLTVLIDGKTAYPPSNFAWAPNSTHTLAVQDTVQPTGTNGLPYQYVFLNWSNGGPAAQTITAGATSTTLTANWKKQFLVSTNVNYPAPNGRNGGAIAMNPQSTNCVDATDCYYDQGATVTLTATPAGAYGFAGWNGDLSGTDPAGVLQVNDQIVVTGNFEVPGTLNPFGIVSGANYTYGNLAPGEIVTIFGLQFGPPSLTTLQVSGGAATTTLAQTRVLFNNVAAPLLYVSTNQIGAIVPYEVAGKTQASIQIQYQGI